MLNNYRILYFLGLLLMTIVSMPACTSGPDIDYIVTGDEEDVDPNAALAACQAQRYVTADCIDLLAEDADRLEEEQASVTLANEQLNDAAGCYSYEIVDAAEDAEDEAETTTDVTSCEDVATNLLAGFDVCVSLAEDVKYYECDDIEEAVNTAVSLCDESSADITVDFCSFINPTTDTTTE